MPCFSYVALWDICKYPVQCCEFPEVTVQASLHLFYSCCGLVSQAVKSELLSASAAMRTLFTLPIFLEVQISFFPLLLLSSFYRSFFSLQFFAVGTAKAYRKAGLVTVTQLKKKFLLTDAIGKYMAILQKHFIK